MSEIKKTENGIIEILAGKLTSNITINDEIVSGIYEASKEFIQSIEKNNKITMGPELNNLIKELLEFSEGYKNLKGEKKKELVIVLVKDIFDEESKKLKLSDDMKLLISSSIELTLEPAIELAVFVSRGGIKINSKETKRIFSKLCPCLSIKK